MKLTEKQCKDLYKFCINEGVDLQYGKLSLCDLRNYNYSMIKDNRRYQTHCDDYKHPFSMIYDELGPAVNKFMELKKIVRGKR